MDNPNTPFTPVKLHWEYKGKHEIYRNSDTYFAQTGCLEHSVGPAGFSIYDNSSNFTNPTWCCVFWHGNRGHHVCFNQPTKEAAMEAAQEHFNKLVNSLMTPRTGAKTAKFRKKPVVIEAIQWTGDNNEEILAFYNSVIITQIAGLNNVMISTLEGDMEAKVGDWIIKGVKGEFYPCKDDIFKATYDPVADDN